MNLFGTTEQGGPLMAGKTAPEDWAYCCFDDDLNGIDWRPNGLTEDGREMFELVLVKKPDVVQYQSIFNNFPDLAEKSSGDLWTKHPTKPHTWHYAARTDDLICFANGLKFFPLAVQQRMQANGSIREALLSAEGHVQTILLVEPTFEALDMIDRGDEQKFRESVWQTVEEVNKDLPSVARIAKTHVLLAPKEKPFLRTSKGTVMRFQTLKAYGSELDQCYEKFGDQSVDMLGRVDRNGTVA